jgi:ribosomal protein L37AE/L43A
MKKILDVDEIRKMTCEEIIEVVRRELDYDEYKWQRENNILIDEPYRAEGLNKALYQCPHCMTEHQMLSKGDKIWCGACGKTWVLGEFGQLRAITGKTEFSHIPAWYKWQYENVKKEVEAGKYYFEDDVDVYALPNVEKFIKLGKGRLVHSIENGMSVEGIYNKTPYKIHRPSRGLYNIHTEYNYCFLRHEPCIQITIADNNIVCYTHKKDVVTKLYFATLAIHEKLMREREEQKKARPKRKPKSKAESE